MSSTIRKQVIADMKVAGLAATTQQDYLGVMDRFIRTTWESPEQATEEQVAGYLRAQIEGGMSQGGFKQTRFALQFLFENTLRREWGLFKKSVEHPSESVFRRYPPRTNAAD